MRYALPTDDGKTVGKVFGRAKSFAIYDDADSSYVIVENESAGPEHGAGTGTSAFLAREGCRNGYSAGSRPQGGGSAQERRHSY